MVELGLRPVVFDTGKRGPGGRASSRIWQGHAVDHAVQFIVATDPEFAAALRATGSARRWGGRLGTLGRAGFVPLDDSVERWVGVEGSGSIIGAWAQGLDVRQDVWVPPANGIRCEKDGSWSVAAPDSRGGRGGSKFDAVVVAHNGKCAERLTSSTPALEVHALLRANFAATLPRSQPGSGKFTLNQVYSLLLEVPCGIMPSSFDGAFVEHEPCLRWLASNTAKLGRKDGASPNTEAWTALSSAEFGKRHKAPQEFLAGTDKEREVIGLLIGGIERAVGIPEGALQAAVLATKLQLWGAALPINRWASKDGVDFVWSASHRIGIAGDWLTSSPARASTVEAAWLSGARLAEHVARCAAADAGLELGEEGGRFVPVAGDFGGGGEAAPAWVAAAQANAGGSGGRGEYNSEVQGGRGDGGKRGGKRWAPAGGR